MKNDLKTPVLIGILVVLGGGLLLFGYRYINSAGDLDHGQISYTPGVPPWDEKDPAKRAQFANMPGELRNGQAAPVPGASGGGPAAGHGPSGPAWSK